MREPLDSPAAPADAPDGVRPAAQRVVPVVGLGGSAGGLQAFERFFRAVERGTGCAFAVIQHLAPEHESILPDLLSSFCALPIEAVTDGTQPLADHVYVIPPNATLVYRAGRLRLEPLEPRVSRQPISAFFGSLAEELGALAAAAVLSGTGSDGASGIRAVKSAGGLTLAQSPAEAQYDAMPRNALATGDVDLVVPAADMPALLVRELRRRVLEGAAPPPQGIDLLSDIARVVAGHTGHDVASYKPTTVLRRVRRRMDVLGLRELEQYRRRVAEHEPEAHALVGELMIAVTRFFRDAEAFESLATVVVPRLLDAARDRTIRVWVPGCSSGEEAYSIAILLREEARRRGAERATFQVFATDIDEAALDVARRGRYPRSVAGDVGPDRLARYFTPSEDRLEVVKEIRDSCIFSTHDVLRDPPFSRLDLVSCRNLLIYFQSDAQERLLPVLHYALRPGGFLLLGSAETVNERTDLLEPIDRRHRIYLRREGERSAPLALRVTTPDPALRPSPPRARPAPAPGLQVIQASLAAFLEGSGAAMALVDASGEARYFAGPFSRFFPTPTGVASLNVLELVPAELRGELTRALARPGHTTTLDLSTSAPAGGRTPLELTVRPAGPTRDLFLLLVQERAPAETAQPGLPDEVSTGRLRDELRAVSDRWRRTVQEQDSTNEQLRSANEELQTMNEELQSANEELQVSQEELQSINEELHTVNAELNKKVEELNQLYADLQNLLQGTQIATVFLDRQLRVGRFTPAAARLFPLGERDAGRRFADLTSPFPGDAVMRLAQAALEGITSQDQVTALADGTAWYLLRAIPYRTLHGAVDGVVLTFVDVTALKRAEAALRTAEERERRRAGELEAIMRAVPAAVLIARDAAASRIEGNDAAYRALRLPPGANTSLSGPEPERPRHFRVVHDGREVPPEDLPVQRAARTGEEIGEYEEQVIFADGSHVHLWGRAVPLRGEDGVPVGAVGAFLDITPLKDAEDRLREADRRKDEFLALLGHELRNPLAALQSGLALAAAAKGDPAELPRHLDLMSRQARVLTRLVDDLLDLTRITRGKIRVRLRAVDLAEVVRHELDARRGPWQERVALDVELPPRAVWVHGDADRIAQMVGNLVGNACKFTDPGGRVRVSVEVEGGAATVRVRDDGIGMDAATVGHLFEPFQQADRSLERARGGLGLGLALVRRLAELMGVEVAAHSDGPGCGSEFTLRFAVVPAPAAEEPAQQPASPPGRLRLLVVEDNHDVAETLAEYLSGLLGHEVALAVDGEAGVARARELVPDAVICDLGLPRLDGFGVARALRADPATARIPLLALSGYGQPEDRDRALAAGFDLHFTKPLPAERLDDWLAQLPRRGADGGGAPAPD